MIQSEHTSRKNVQIASFGQFHIPYLVEGLGSISHVEYLTNWSPKKPAPPNFGPSPVLCRHLHYPLKAFERYPKLQHGFWMHFGLSALFDGWLKHKVKPETDVLYIHNGCGLNTIDRFRKLSSGAVVIDSGSTHTDWQHRIVHEEFLKNGIRTPLFHQGYRKRCREEVGKADFVQIPSHFVKQTYIEEGVLESKLLLAPYGADINTFHPATEPIDRPFRLICPSGYNLRKGARILVEAWRKLNLKDAELHWIGSVTPDVEHLFQEPLKGLVSHGYKNHADLAALLRSCDAIVLPSLEEGLARVLVEAAASGLALIATPNSGVMEIFKDSPPMGWLVQAGSVDQLCDAILAAKEDRALTRQYGLNAAARANAAFTVEHYLERVRKNFRQVTGY